MKFLVVVLAFVALIISNDTGITTRSYGNNKLFANAVSDGTPPTPAGATSSGNGLRQVSFAQKRVA